MNPEDIYKALHLCTVELPPDPDPQSSRTPKSRSGMPPMPTSYPNIKVRHFHILGSECDYLMINTYTGVVAEFEIKVTRSDLLRECRIAQASRGGNQSTLLESDSWKHTKHSSFHTGRQLPPNYYSFVVPHDLLDTCRESAPEYAGI